MNDQKIMIMLDTLVDTRMGTIKRYWPDKALEIAMDGYHARVFDDWQKHGISREAFKVAYKKRDVETLKHSTVAFMSALLNEAVTEAIEAAATIAVATPVTFYLNTYPYSDLSEQERRAYKKALSIIIGHRAKIELTYIPYERMGIDEIRSTYGAIIIYDWLDWLEVISEQMKEKYMPRVQVVAPALYHSPIPEAEVKGNGDDAFAETELQCAQHFRLCLQPVKYFSFVVVAKNNTTP